MASPPSAEADALTDWEEGDLGRVKAVDPVPPTASAEGTLPGAVVVAIRALAPEISRAKLTAGLLLPTVLEAGVCTVGLFPAVALARAAASGGWGTEVLAGSWGWLPGPWACRDASGVEACCLLLPEEPGAKGVAGSCSGE